ncbi:MAG: sterol desaturase family protein [Moraxellaceae bacterium]|nr:sterol desaturase family protein [Moraxellaceae bacterium]
MAHDVDAFRARYRAAIHPRYNAWWHGGFVFGLGMALIAFLLMQLQAVQGWEWLAVPVALVFFNWGEYTVHLELGHRKRPWGRLFYQRHTGDHHSFFVQGRMQFETPQDWRVIFFPAWLIVVYSLLLVLPAYVLLGLLNTNVAALFAASLLAGYLSYEFFHACEHLPPTHPLARLPGIRQMREHHDLHHRRDLMQTHNFNIVFPLQDVLRGTRFREPPA